MNESKWTYADWCRAVKAYEMRRAMKEMQEDEESGFETFIGIMLAAFLVMSFSGVILWIVRH